MNFFEILKIVSQLLPMLIEAIKAIEEAIPGKGKGEMKLAAIREILESVAALTGEGIMDQVWPVLQKVIASIVNLFNATGVFNK